MQIVRFQLELSTNAPLSICVPQVDLTGSEPMINASLDPELLELASQIREVQASIDSLVESARDEWPADVAADFRCERDKQRGWVFRTKTKNDKAVRAIPGVAVCQVLKDGLYFTTTGKRGLQTFAERMAESEDAYRQLSSQLVASLLSVAATFLPVLEAAASILAELDAFYSMASLVAGADAYCLPTVLEAGTGDIVVRGARHPVVEVSTPPSSRGEHATQ